MRVLAALLLCVIGCFPMSPVESHLDRQLKSWQRRLGMDDWRLTIRLVRQNDLDKNTWGNAEWDPHGKTGTISVLDVADYNLRGAKLKLDMECTIVHELVHIQVGPFDAPNRSEEHTSELQSLRHLVCRLLLEKKKKQQQIHYRARSPDRSHGITKSTAPT